MPLTKEQKKQKVKNQALKRYTTKVHDRETVFKQAPWSADIKFATLYKMNRFELETLSGFINDMIKIRKNEESLIKKGYGVPEIVFNDAKIIEDVIEEAKEVEPMPEIIEDVIEEAKEVEPMPEIIGEVKNNIIVEVIEEVKNNIIVEVMPEKIKKPLPDYKPLNDRDVKMMELRTHMLDLEAKWREEDSQYSDWSLDYRETKRRNAEDAFLRGTNYTISGSEASSDESEIVETAREKRNRLRRERYAKKKAQQKAQQK